jgi:regulator of RNase E activity RraA
MVCLFLAFALVPVSAAQLFTFSKQDLIDYTAQNPIRIGNVTVMPGDLAVGDREGVYFVPPQFVQEVLDRADVVHIHDEWTKKKFAEGKYKSSEIYGSPKDPKLKEEYQQYLKQRLEELKKERAAKQSN